MDLPIKKTWNDNRQLSQVVGPDSCFIIKDRKKLVCACNQKGKIKVKVIEIE